MYVTRHSRLALPLIDQLWELYERCYRETAEAAVTREQLYRSEFEAAVTDPTNRLWILWKDEQPIGVFVLASDIGATRYLSRAYLEARYPEKIRQGLVRYILFVVIDREHSGLSAAIKLGRTAFALEAQEGALVVFDVPAKNHGQRGTLADLARRIAALSGTATLSEIEVQRYYALDFHSAGDLDAEAQLELFEGIDEHVTV
jgi:hypothetical protein